MGRREYFRSRLMQTKFFSFLSAIYFYDLLMRHHWFDHWCSGNIIWGIWSCILNHLKVFYWVLTGISSGKMASKLHSWKDRICIIWTQHCFFFFARKHLFFNKNTVISKGLLPNFIKIQGWQCCKSIHSLGEHDSEQDKQLATLQDTSSMIASNSLTFCSFQIIQTSLAVQWNRSAAECRWCLLQIWSEHNEDYVSYAEALTKTGYTCGDD